MATSINTTALKVYGFAPAEAEATRRVFSDNAGVMWRVYIVPITGASFTSQMIAYLVDVAPAG